MENYGFLLLCSHLGNPDRKPLTTAQLRLLARRVRLSLKTTLKRFGIKLTTPRFLLPARLPLPFVSVSARN